MNGSGIVELPQESNAFPARFTKKFDPIRSARREADPMIDPGHVGCGAKERLELRIPKRALERQKPGLKIAEPIGVKIDVASFILQNERAGFLQHRITRPPMEQPIIGSSDQLCDDEKLNLELESERVTDQPKQAVRPMVANGLAAETMDQSLQQARVFSFFRDE